MKKKYIHFSPSLFPTIATVLGIGLFVSLGQWQIQRADEKTQILEQFTQNKTKPIIALPSEISKESKMLTYRNVFFFGIPLVHRQFLLDNQIRNGKAGINIITPFERDDGSTILVDRGWMEFSRGQLPVIELPKQRMRIQGTIYIPPGKAFSLGTFDADADTWPRLITHLDYAAIGEKLGVTIPELTVRMDPHKDSNQAQAYLRQWPGVALLQPDRNLAYAIQWFALALTVLILFIALNLKIHRKQQ